MRRGRDEVVGSAAERAGGPRGVGLGRFEWRGKGGPGLVWLGFLFWVWAGSSFPFLFYF